MNTVFQMYKVAVLSALQIIVVKVSQTRFHKLLFSSRFWETKLILYYQYFLTHHFSPPNILTFKCAQRPQGQTRHEQSEISLLKINISLEWYRLTFSKHKPLKGYFVWYKEFNFQDTISKIHGDLIFGQSPIFFHKESKKSITLHYSLQDNKKIKN